MSDLIKAEQACPRIPDDSFCERRQSSHQTQSAWLPEATVETGDLNSGKTSMHAHMFEADECPSSDLLVPAHSTEEEFSSDEEDSNYKPAAQMKSTAMTAMLNASRSPHKGTARKHPSRDAPIGDHREWVRLKHPQAKPHLEGDAHVLFRNDLALCGHCMEHVEYARSMYDNHWSKYNDKVLWRGEDYDTSLLTDNERKAFVKARGSASKICPALLAEENRLIESSRDQIPPDQWNIDERHPAYQGRQYGSCVFKQQKDPITNVTIDVRQEFYNTGDQKPRLTGNKITGWIIPTKPPQPRIHLMHYGDGVICGYCIPEAVQKNEQPAIIAISRFDSHHWSKPTWWTPEEMRKRISKEEALAKREKRAPKQIGHHCNSMLLYYDNPNTQMQGREGKQRIALFPRNLAHIRCCECEPLSTPATKNGTALEYNPWTAMNLFSQADDASKDDDDGASFAVDGKEGDDFEVTDSPLDLHNARVTPAGAGQASYEATENKSGRSRNGRAKHHDYAG